MPNDTRLVHQPRGVIADLAERNGMDPVAFERTMRATVFPGDASKEELAAFLLVARKYDLDPLTKQIYAFKARSGAIVPIIPIDGWAAIVNGHPQFDGVEFEDHVGDAGLAAITCRMYRKDRKHPIEVTEYMAECARGTEPWKQWPARMLRHKAYMQCARYAFGISGVSDPDEGERIIQGERVVETIPMPLSKEEVVASMRQGPQRAETAPPQGAAEAKAIHASGALVDRASGEIMAPATATFTPSEPPKPVFTGSASGGAGGSESGTPVDKATGEVKDGADLLTQQAQADPMMSRRLATRPQKDMLVAVAVKRHSFTPEALNAWLVDNYAFTIESLPMALVNDAVAKLSA